MRHLNEKDRYYIEVELKKKTSVKEIARALGFSRVSIYAEIKKGLSVQRDTYLRDRTVYLSDVGQKKHDDAMKRTGRTRKLSPDDEALKDVARLILECRYSPEAALYRTGCRKVCVKTLYNYIHGKYIPGIAVQNLPYARERKKKKQKVVKRPFSPRGKSIEERPENVMERNQYGHWEMDTVYSARGDRACLLVLSERMTRQEIIMKIKDRTCPSVIKALDRIERRMGAPAFRETFRTITCDNGAEFSSWQEIERSCLNRKKRTTVYFCHPYCSGERGTNENINRMIRRWIPKGDDIGLYSVKETSELERWVNSYPRKIFGGLSSDEYRKICLG